MWKKIRSYLPSARRAIQAIIALAAAKFSFSFLAALGVQPDVWLARQIVIAPSVAWIDVLQWLLAILTAGAGLVVYERWQSGKLAPVAGTVPSAPKPPTRTLSANEKIKLLDAVAQIAELCSRGAELVRKCQDVKSTIQSGIAPFTDRVTAMNFQGSANYIGKILGDAHALAQEVNAGLFGAAGVVTINPTLRSEADYIIANSLPGRDFLVPLMDLRTEIETVQRDVSAMNAAMSNGEAGALGIARMLERVLQTFEQKVSAFETHVLGMQSRAEEVRNLLARPYENVSR
jgi:hypothetical protein